MVLVVARRFPLQSAREEVHYHRSILSSQFGRVDGGEVVPKGTCHEGLPNGESFALFLALPP